jgi:hypothetical protein
MPRSINRHHYRWVEHVGPAPTPKKMPKKGKNTLPQPWLYVGRPSPLGNPFHFQRGDLREDLLEQYRLWLWQKIRENDWRVMLALRSITEETALVCSCAPKPCHSDVVIRAWNWMREKGLL